MSSVLRRQPLSIEAAEDPADGVLPLLTGVARAGFDATAAPYPDMASNLEYGHTRTLLPYTNQSTYTRVHSRRDLPSIVLENEYLRATFLPGSGGRLWSLVHRPTGRELLHRNPVYQPANLALRDAWLAGGVEWNLGATGHRPLAADLLAAARGRPDGTGRHAGVADVRVRAAAAHGAGDRRLAAAGLGGAARPRGDHEPGGAGGAGLLVVEHRGAAGA